VLTRFHSWRQNKRRSKAFERFFRVLQRKGPLLQQENKRRIIKSGIAVFVLIVIVLIFTGYWFHLHWTGFDGGYSTTTIQSTSHGTTTTVAEPSAKSLWDWLQLLFIPAVLAFGGL
jgi:uncharacterized membrane protein